MHHALQQVVAGEGIKVAQRKDWAEILVGWETGNRYDITDLQGRSLLFAAEKKGDWLQALWRQVGWFRAVEIEFKDREGQTVLTLRKPWTFWLARAEVRDGDGRELAVVQERFRFFAKHHEVLDGAGQAIASVTRAWFKVWHFDVNAAGRVVGTIKKRWGGFGLELFTDADRFRVEWSHEAPSTLRAVMVALAVMVDLTSFEQSGHKGLLSSVEVE